MAEGAPETIDALLGKTIAGKYRVESLIGHGGMGVVLEATNEMLGAKVAVKLLRRSGADNPEQEARLLREAQVAARLRSEHVARVLDVGRQEDGSLFLVMEHLTGQNLATLLAERGELPVAEAVDYVLQALDALAEAHRKGLVHRDLKPANLFLTTKNDGSPLLKVLDFGIVKTSPGENEAAITGGDTVGSPMYMSPEQIREARSVDARADIWSLGVILYELLAGQPPFSADSVGGVFARIFSEEIAPITSHRPDVPGALAAVIHGCLTADRERRIPEVSTLASMLAPFASERGRLVSLSVIEVYSSSSERSPSDPSQRASNKTPRAFDEAAITQTSIAAAPALPSGSVAPLAASVVGPSPPGATLQAPAPPRSPAVLVAALVAALGLGALALRAGAPGGPAASPSSAASGALIPPTSPLPAASPDATASAAPSTSQAHPAAAASSAGADSAGRAGKGAPTRPVRRGGLDLDRRDLPVRLRLLCLLLACAVPALAEPTGADKALAEALFRDGRALMSSSKFAEACPKFAESQRLDPRLGTLLNLAICHEKEGKSASSWAEFTDVAAQAARLGEAERESFAREQAQGLARRLSRLKVVASGASLELKLDGKVLGPGVWGTAIPLDPGEHRVEASAPGKIPWSQVVQIAAGPASIDLEVPPLRDAPAPLPAAPSASAAPALAPAPSAPAASPPPTTAGPDAAAPSGAWRRPVGWAGVGVGVLGLGLGSYFGYQTIDRHRASKDECDAAGCSPRGHDLQQEAFRSARWSNASFALGLLGGAAGVYLLLTSPPAGSPGPSVALSPSVAPGFSGLHVRGGF